MNSRKITLVGLMAAIMCVLGPISIPVGPISISFLTLAIFLSLYITGTKFTLYSYFIYCIIGAVGMPVFSNYSGGLSKIMGITGGFIFGFYLVILISGLFVEKFENKLIHFLGMVVGTIISYVIGVIWFVILTKSELTTALTICVLPFIPGDIIKILMAIFIGKKLKYIKKQH